MRRLKSSSFITAGKVSLLAFLFVASAAAGEPTKFLNSPTNIFAPASTPTRSILHLSVFVLVITGIIFAIAFTLLAYSIVKFRGRVGDAGREPAQVYGSTQIELAWTIIPILIVVVLFLATARVIHAIQDAPEPVGAVQVTVIGHQYWWEFRYPKLGIVTANELHIPVSDPKNPAPLFLTLLSADTDHSFWVPELALSRPFVCKGDDGHWQPNYSSIGGDLATTALENAYYPESNRGAGLVFGHFALNSAERAVSSVAQEFLLRKLTPKAKPLN